MLPLESNACLYVTERQNVQPGLCYNSNSVLAFRAGFFHGE